MATLSHDAPSAGHFARFFAGLRAVFAVAQAARRASVEYETLSRLSDKELAKRGLTRQSIAQLVAARHLDV